MASILRQIVAGPRVRHPKAQLDLCYVTEFIIVTCVVSPPLPCHARLASPRQRRRDVDVPVGPVPLTRWKSSRSGPSQTWPRVAYRNPLDRLKAFLEDEHGDDWAIWEFRAEGTGYPDDAVYGRVRHYPWPDHQPPPFRLVPMILASMRNWLHGGDLDVQPSSSSSSGPSPSPSPSPGHDSAKAAPAPSGGRHGKRVVVVHCKAGKGRSGTISCSYLISEEGWTAKDAMARFTQRRMKPGFGPGVSIPSQLRWVSYVDRWTRHGKRYVDRPVEIVEIHVWGLRSGVKIGVNGFVRDGKEVREFHAFSARERVVVEPGEPPRSGFVDVVRDLAGYSVGAADKVPEQVELADEANSAGVERKTAGETSGDEAKGGKTKGKLGRKGAQLIQKVQLNLGDGIEKAKSKTGSGSSSSSSNLALEGAAGASSSDDELPGGLEVVFKPAQPIRVPNSDVNVALEQRSRTHKRLNWTMVSAVAHVWFNVFFEGRGPEQQGQADDSGVFTIAWEAMDGFKGSSRKGWRALDKMSVVWRVAGDAGAGGEEIVEPGEGEPVPQVAAADWRGAPGGEGGKSERDLGLRVQTQASADVSCASSLRSVERSNDGHGLGDGDGDGGGSGSCDTDDLEGLRSAGPGGEDLVPDEEPGKK
ncbi:phosphoinositide 3-phosphate phosphatase [Metarhizium album ARSEF 1941]|uniref:phosphatidylinositol-3,4,5-trisphosphate 3-phosphatase n=1 Tax=Metarhizium album (strain ARSEF 1941) TaxID=1081103 RepID=A0A0B2WQU7_METAS|nr:phosphoinositide 3-phosphate phosphatase [Metarhizium album ARSEF 1941]KHN98436.1 phosphoinositide 3-phosphate phosphatase [Metarhizium album ARSEF 1941]